MAWPAPALLPGSQPQHLPGLADTWGGWGGFIQAMGPLGQTHALSARVWLRIMWAVCLQVCGPSSLRKTASTSRTSWRPLG